MALRTPEHLILSLSNAPRLYLLSKKNANVHRLREKRKILFGIFPAPEREKFAYAPIMSRKEATETE